MHISSSDSLCHASLVSEACVPLLIVDHTWICCVKGQSLFGRVLNIFHSLLISIYVDCYFVLLQQWQQVINDLLVISFILVEDWMVYDNHFPSDEAIACPSLELIFYPLVLCWSKINWFIASYSITLVLTSRLRLHGWILTHHEARIQE